MAKLNPSMLGLLARGVARSATSDASALACCSSRLVSSSSVQPAVAQWSRLMHRAAAIAPEAGPSDSGSHLRSSARGFAASASEPGKGAADKPADEQTSTSGSEGEEGAAVSVEDLQANLKQAEADVEKMKQEVQQLTDSLKRALAEMENVRARTTREVENTKKFAVQGFVKSLLDVADNLDRAATSVPPAAVTEEGAQDAQKTRALLKGLLEGVQMTLKTLLQAMGKAGVQQYDPMNQKFDPNLHNALFEVPDPTKEAGTVAVVTKKGYTMHERVIRPAEVGVARAP